MKATLTPLTLASITGYDAIETWEIMLGIAILFVMLLCLLNTD